jgi:hypothetical protein
VGGSLISSTLKGELEGDLERGDTQRRSLLRGTRLKESSEEDLAGDAEGCLAGDTETCLEEDLEENSEGLGEDLTGDTETCLEEDLEEDSEGCLTGDIETCLEEDLEEDSEEDLETGFMF